jgi:5-methylcytosine-specific restriction endonuclease McrA
MEEELQKIEEMMKSEISEIKEKYKKIKKEVRDNYKSEEKKPKRKSIPKTLKNDVWDKYIGREKGVGNCEVCSGEIECRSFHCGHVKSVKEGGDTIIENMRPICGTCNTSMGTENLFEFKEKYYKEKQLPNGNKITSEQQGFNILFPSKFQKGDAYNPNDRYAYMRK